MLSTSGGAPTARWREIADLLVPGIKTIGLHADSDVEIEPDAHAELGWRASLAACSWLSAVHCTNSTNSTSCLSGPLRISRSISNHLGCCHSSGHSHHGDTVKRWRSTSKQAKRDNSGPRSARKASNWLTADTSVAVFTKLSKAARRPTPL